MEPHELQQSLTKALAHAEHAIEGAIILGQSATNSLAQAKIQCQELTERLQATDQQSKVTSQDSAKVQHHRAKNEAVDVNGATGATNDSDHAVLSPDLHAEVQIPDATADTVKTRIPEPMKTVPTLRATNTGLFGLIEQLENSDSSRSKSVHSVLENLVRRQGTQIAATEADVASKEAEIALLKHQRSIEMKAAAQSTDVASLDPLSSFVTPALANTDQSTRANQTMPFQLYPILTDEQRKYKQIAMMKEQENKEIFESFLRSMKNLKSSPYANLTDSSGRYVSSSHSVNVAQPSDGQPRKIPDTKLNPETPPFTPLRAQATVTSVSSDQHETDGDPKSPEDLEKSSMVNYEHMEVLVDDFYQRSAPSHMGASEKSETAVKQQVERSTVGGSAVTAKDSSTIKSPFNVGNSDEKQSLAKSSIVDNLDQNPPSSISNVLEEPDKGISGLPKSSISGTTTNSKAIRDPSFDAFVGQQMKAPAPTPAVSAKKADNMASSIDSITQDFEILQEPIGPDDLIDLSSNAASPFRSMTKRMRNVATNSAAFMAAATTAYSSFNSKLYGPQNSAGRPKEEDDELSIDEEDYITVQRPSTKPSVSSRRSLSPAFRTLVDKANQKTTPEPSPSTVVAAPTIDTAAHFASTHASQSLPKGLNPHHDDSVETYVIRPNSRGNWHELLLDWKHIDTADVGNEENKKGYFVLEGLSSITGTTEGKDVSH